ncbi:multidrug effflux MFS transporter [Streptomyces morookaense]|uniref:Multidrug effflux MFS transporter n=1 Tax=Streptomyces morookaense TaxID=1970 RepID=A0A7Y7B031_STRMO|nr:multidrug effflux MFS transporter [Streptomyces morookaense]NVK76568.1 multidrug effflux MFS transporter [Streptomyces morookaense]GHF08030.1 Bcr/CflA family drug resistance efflux transporter [Streptomyces morookaense]
MPMMTAALVLLSFVTPLATDMYLPAFPRMTGDLGTDASGVQLTLTSFLIGMGLGQLILGPLSDRFGRRKPILVGSAACVVATALCALTPSLGWLIALRFVQGFTGAAGIVIGRAVISDVATGERAAKLLGILMSLLGVAPAIAPVLGGVVIETAGWRAVFWALAATTLLALAGTLFAVPETLPAGRRRAGGARATARSVREVLADRPYLGHTLCFGMSLAVLFCYLGGASFLFQNLLGLGIGQTSAAFGSVGAVSVIAGLVITRLVGRFTPQALLRAGLGVMLAGSIALCVLALAGGLNVPVVLALLYVTFVGIGLVSINAAALALERVPHAAGTGSALLGTVQSALSAVAAPLVGLGGAHTAVPMFAGMTLSSVLAVLVLGVAKPSSGAGA